MEQKAAQRISSAHRTLIVSHVSPDGDAIGSLLGLGLMLQSRGQEAVMACADPVPTQYQHLPQSDQIVRRPSGQFDLVVSLDCSDLERLGPAYDGRALSGVPIVNIDHHATNVRFGIVNWVDPTSAATTQMLVQLAHALQLPLSQEIATCLLNGLLTDTLGFRTSNTTAEVMRAAVELIQAGAPMGELTDRIFNHRPLGTIRIWGLALQTLCLEERILWTTITRDMRRQADYCDNGDGGLVNFLSTANEADMAVIFDELESGAVNVSMRAVSGYDVSKVALALGGGGHPQAAGCTLAGPLHETRQRVLSMLRLALYEQD